MLLLKALGSMVSGQCGIQTLTMQWRSKTNPKM